MRRGYIRDARIDDKEEDVGHLVFVVHGIGQKMRSESIVERCSEYARVSIQIQTYLYFHPLLSRDVIQSRAKRIYFLASGFELCVRNHE